MKINDAQLEKLLATASRPELGALLWQRRLVPSPPQAAKLAQHLAGLEPPCQPVRLGIVHTYTSELLDPWLAYCGALHQVAFEVYHAPYGVTFQEASAQSGLAAFAPDVTLLLLRREDLLPDFQTPLAAIAPGDRAALRQRLHTALTQLVAQLRATVAGQLVVTLLPELHAPGLGLYDGMAEHSGGHWWDATRAELAAKLRQDMSGVSFLDLEQLLARVGRDNFFDLRLWYSSVFPFATEGALALCDATARIAASLHLTRAKVIAVDADNTLWGGIIGEDGMDGIALGPEYPGRAYVDFQKRLLSLQQRGFILALCSKNNPDDVQQVLREHPHQLLRAEHFAAQRVNWQPKPENLQALAEELNLGLDAFVFIDDSDHECHAVRHSLPQVEVVQVPSRPVEIPACLDHLARLEITSLTEEDLAKTAMYAQERQRKSQLAEITAGDGNIDDYLRSLGMHMTVCRDDRAQLPRLAQLTQKTNQFNLTTRRYSEQDMTAFIDSEDALVYHFSLRDNFGDSGVVGLAIVRREAGADAALDSFLMSCRVIGRRAEQAFLHTLLNDLRARGVKQLRAEYLPTRKNVLVANFLVDNGFAPTDDGGYVIDPGAAAADAAASLPITIQGPAT